MGTWANEVENKDDGSFLDDNIPKLCVAYDISQYPDDARNRIQLR